MAHEISPICNFLFGSIRTNLPMDTVDIELTVWMVKCTTNMFLDDTYHTLPKDCQDDKILPEHHKSNIQVSLCS